MKEFSDFISQVGFPIVVSILMILQQQKMSENYMEIVESLKELVKDNTSAIQLVIKGVKTYNENQEEIK